ncbi:hypothetical protein LCGC14_0369770 [marine sediment metagenome]|uniref:Uncharacterized protein n=1 Tax=marine sediment metagenome TaxID=412755 RepID=A0A0F9WE03_9ZZZZ
MITRVNERQIMETGEDICGGYFFTATVRDGKVTKIDSLYGYSPSETLIRSYVHFLGEVLEAMGQTY